MDFLGLRTLTVISDTIKLVKQGKGIDVEFDKEMNDPNVFEKTWRSGNTSGIFQFESSGMTSFMVSEITVKVLNPKKSIFKSPKFF